MVSLTRWYLCTNLRKKVHYFQQAIDNNAEWPTVRWKLSGLGTLSVFKGFNCIWPSAMTDACAERVSQYLGNLNKTDFNFTWEHIWGCILQKLTLYCTPSPGGCVGSVAVKFHAFCTSSLDRGNILRCLHAYRTSDIEYIRNYPRWESFWANSINNGTPPT